ncbi:uncharacterized protein [Aristolochia californica]|uniref:uncharacterized protein isoform X2 n=2 Tax=Aristolochia californica TaxID=171875 RepID=UPI0035D8A153
MGTEEAAWLRQFAGYAKSVATAHQIFPLNLEKACSVGNYRPYTRSPQPVRYIAKHAKNQESQSSEPMNSLMDNGINCSLDSSLLDMSISRDKRTIQVNQSLGEEDAQNHLTNKPLSSERRSDAESVKENEILHQMVDFSELEEDKDCEMNVTSTNKTKQDAEKLAIGALATRAFSVFELQKKLCAKKFPLAVIEAVMVELQERGLLNDYSYAESFARSRWHSFSWGPGRIKQALLQKGINEANAKKAIKEVFEGSDHNQVSLLGMSKSALDRLFDQALKQWMRGKDVALETRKSRIVRWLQYRGFNWAVTSFILKKLEAKS